MNNVNNVPILTLTVCFINQKIPDNDTMSLNQGKLISLKYLFC